MRFLIPAFAIFINIAYATRNVFVSSPFDNFRVECSKRSAAVEVAVSMVQSAGGKRQDIVFEMACENVNELYPWVNMPEGIKEKEKEDCHYSSMFDPILATKTEYTCAPREYVAGIARLTDTRIQVMCCRLRSRDEFNCQEFNFNKPLTTDRTIIEHENQVINALRIDRDGIVVRFCDLSPRSYENVMIDYKTTLEKKAQVKPKKSSIKVDETVKTTLHATQATEQPTLTNSKTKQNNTHSKNGVINQSNNSNVMTTEDTIKRTQVKSSKPTTTTTTTTTTSTTTTTTAQTTTPTTTTTTTTSRSTPAVTTETTTITTTEATTTPSTTARPETTPETTTVTTTSPLTSQAPVRIIQEPILQETNSNIYSERAEQKKNETFTQKRVNTFNNEFSKVTFNNNEFPSLSQTDRKKVKAEKLSNIKKQDNTDASEFIFIHPINSNARRRAPVRPYISLWSSEEEEEIDESRFSTPRREKYKIVRRVVSDKNRRNKPKDETDSAKVVSKEQIDNAREIDEETAKSPFDFGHTESFHVNSLIGSGPMLEDIIRAGNVKDSVFERSNGLSNVQVKEEEETEEKEEETKVVEPTQPTQLTETQFEQTEEDVTTTEKPLVVFGNIATTAKPYNAAEFYHTNKRKLVVKEKYLTFCTKDVALRDERNMVLACGMENDIWQPKRCPEGTDCFHSKDSTYRICCPVARG